MDHFIRAFTRVLRNIDDADSLIESFPQLENVVLSDPSSLTDHAAARGSPFPLQMWLPGTVPLFACGQSLKLFRAVIPI